MPGSYRVERKKGEHGKLSQGTWPQIIAQEVEILSSRSAFLRRDQEMPKPGNKPEGGPRHQLLAPEFSFLNKLIQSFEWKKADIARKFSLDPLDAQLSDLEGVLAEISLGWVSLQNKCQGETLWLTRTVIWQLSIRRWLPKEILRSQEHSLLPAMSLV